MNQLGYTPPAELRSASMRALIVGVVFTVILLIGAFVDRAQFFHAYLVGFIFWTGITVGSLALLALQHLTGGAWGLVIRRVLEASTRTLPLMIVLFLPIAFGVNQIYLWTNSGFMNQTLALHEKAAKFLNPSFFLMRTALYFAIWSALAIVLNWFSIEQDRTGDPKLRKRMQMISGPGVVLFVLTTTFASIDWAMSLDPAWSSTSFGFIFVAAWTLSALAFTILVSAWLSERAPMNEVLRPAHFQDLGN